MARMVEADPSSTDEPDATGEPRSRPRLTQPPYRNALVVMAIAVTMVSIFAVSYTLALGRPTPHDIPAAVVGHLARRPGVIPALEATTDNSVRLSSYASLARAAIGNAASGGAVAPPLLPAFYRFVGRFLPNGATVETIRNAVYFTDHQHLEPILVEAAWITSALVLLLIAAERRGRTPGTG
jgi:hypothetical protein